MWRAISRLVDRLCLHPHMRVFPIPDVLNRLLLVRCPVSAQVPPVLAPEDGLLDFNRRNRAGDGYASCGIDASEACLSKAVDDVAPLVGFGAGGLILATVTINYIPCANCGLSVSNHDEE